MARVPRLCTALAALMLSWGAHSYLSPNLQKQKTISDPGSSALPENPCPPPLRQWSLHVVVGRGRAAHHEHHLQAGRNYEHGDGAQHHKRHLPTPDERNGESCDERRDHLRSCHDGGVVILHTVGPQLQCCTNQASGAMRRRCLWCRPLRLNNTRATPSHTSPFLHTPAHAWAPRNTWRYTIKPRAPPSLPASGDNTHSQPLQGNRSEGRVHQCRASAASSQIGTKDGQSSWKTVCLLNQYSIRQTTFELFIFAQM